MIIHSFILPNSKPKSVYHPPMREEQHRMFPMGADEKMIQDYLDQLKNELPPLSDEDTENLNNLLGDE